jgi:tetratricopeptide (TPR) repeat protein
LAAMARKKRKTALKEEAPKAPSDREQIAEECSEHKILAKAENSVESPVDADQSTKTQTIVSQHRPLFAAIRSIHLSRLQIVLVVCIFLTAIVLFYGLSKSLSGPRAGLAAVTTEQQKTTGDQPDISEQAIDLEMSTLDSEQLVPSEIKEPESGFASTEPLSLKVADDYYLQGDWAKAYAAYKQLLQNLSSTDQKALRDFLKLKMALCVRKAERATQAERMLRSAAQSRFAVVAAMAKYYQCMDLIQNKKYLQASSKAYQIIALLDAVDYDRGWALSLQQDCFFLVPECLTRNVLELCDADKELPNRLFSNLKEVDPFIGLGKEQLLRFLNSGSDQLSKALLGPQVRKIERTDGTVRWQVICYGASIEELLARFANNAGLEIKWICEPATPTEGRVESVQKRVVYLYMSAATPLQFVTVAAGCAGLLARIYPSEAGEDNHVVEILDPSDYSSLSECVTMLAEEAIPLWRRLLLTSNTFERVPNIHFVLGLLQAQRGRPSDAIAEFKLVANRFANSPFAPYALLHASKLKVDLRDYSGARNDFKQLVEQYPDTEFSHEACLFLADATMKAGLFDEAASTYRKVYNLSLSVQAQTASALGAGRCFYETKEYEAAARWLNRYLNLSDDHKSKDFSVASFLLGKAYLALGEPQQACNVFQQALDGPLPREQHIEAISALVEAYIQQDHLVDAIDVLEDTSAWQFSQRESVEVLLLRARIFRSMGLVDKAMAVLADRADYLPDPELKARIQFEMTKCYVAKRQWERAHKSLSGILVIVEPGPFAQEVEYELAQVSLKLNRVAQTIAICCRILKSAPSETIREKTSDLLARAYTQQKDYNRAALALLGEQNQ